LTIGDFARATHLSVKALRYYHSVGVLKPAVAIDPATGYRRYRTDQIAVAQIIRRFRSLDMPIEDIQSILAAPDVAIRSQVIATHLNRLEELLDRTHRATASLRDLLQAQAAPPLTDLAHVSVPAGFSGGDHRVAGFEHNIYALNRAHDAHVAVQKYLCFENVHVARAKTAKHLVKHLNRGFQPSRRKRRGIEPQGILGPVFGALRPCHRFTHLLDDRDDRCLVLLGVGR
jgi:DNA-binding transcriptional MerR regulator